MDDILDMLKGDDKPFESVTTTTTEDSNGKDDFDYYGDPEVTPMKINVSNFKSCPNAFLVTNYVPGGEISEEIHKELLELSKAMCSKGYIFRHTGDVKDKLQNAILEIDGVKSESYLPWAKFNTNIKSPKMKKPNPLGYKIAADNHKAFKKMSNGIRCILARNVHAILGVDCVEPVKFILAYSADGAEGITKGIDYKLTGNVAFFLKVAEDSNIPVFNIKNKDAVKRLVEFINLEKEI